MHFGSVGSEVIQQVLAFLKENNAFYTGISISLGNIPKNTCCFCQIMAVIKNQKILIF